MSNIQDILIAFAWMLNTVLWLYTGIAILAAVLVARAEKDPDFKARFLGDLKGKRIYRRSFLAETADHVVPIITIIIVGMNQGAVAIFITLVTVTVWFTVLYRVTKPTIKKARNLLGEEYA